MQKARLSVHLGPVKSFMGQTHQDYTCNTQEELNHEIVMERVMGYSGSGSKVIDRSTGRTTIKGQVGGAVSGGAVSSKREVTDQVTFAPEVVSTIRDVKGNHSPLTWAVITYERSDSALLVVQAAGEGEEGNVAECVSHLNDNNVAYCIIRKTEQIDNSLTAKFIYIRWIGNGIPRMQKAKLGTHAGDIYNLFAPCHTSLDSPDLHEITDENIMKQIMIASGSYKHVLEGHPVPVQQPQHRPQTAPKPTSGRTSNLPRETDTHGGAVKTIERVVEYHDEEGVKQAIQEVRNDNNDSDWVLVTYDAPQSKTLKLAGIGSGGLQEMKSYLTDDVVMYGLLRVIERIDDSVTVKFVYVDWRGEQIHRMQRAKLATHSGAVRAMFHPFHLDIQPTQEDELTETIIEKKIKAVSGTAVHVL